MSKDKKDQKNNKRVNKLNGFQKVKLGLCTTFAAIIGTQFVINRLSLTCRGLQIEFAGTDNITVAIMGSVLLVLVYIDRLDYKEARDFELRKQRIEQNPNTDDLAKKLFKTFFPDN
jgi:hypothetical protein